MQILGALFNTVLIHPIVNLLMVFYQGFSYINIPGALGFSIIGVTVAIRLAINPLMKHQIEQSQQIQALQPKLTQLQKKYKKEPTKLQQAQVQLYKQHNINPGFGCLIFLVQFPVFIGLYQSLNLIVTQNGGIAKTLSAINDMLYFGFLKISTLEVSFFGFNLHEYPRNWQKVGWWYLAVPIVTGALQFYQAYLTGKLNKSTAKKPTAPVKKGEKKEEKKDNASDMQAMMQKQMLFFFPLMIGWFSFNFPLGLALYWNTFTLMGIAQYMEQIKAKKTAIVKK